MTFQAFGLHEPILRAVACKGYTAPTPIQVQAIPHVMAGRDLLGCAQTGTGKTAAYALPILHRLTSAGNPARGSGRRIRVLVLSPTRELASQIFESFQAYGRHTSLRHVAVFGGVSQHGQVRALRNGVDILVATPGRLCDLMNQGFINLASVETFVLDEADRMLDMGFLPDVRRVIGKLPAARQTLLFSATMPAPIEKLAREILRDPTQVRVAPVKETTELIQESVCFVPREQKPALLASLLAARSVERAIVFTRTKHGADRVTRHLNRCGIGANAIHGNKSQNARQRTLAGFKAGHTRVLVATDLAARGLDVTAVSHVFNFDLPVEPETYLHRIGRTGRAGARGISVSFCASDERQHLKSIERLIHRTLTVEKDLPAGLAAAPAASRPPRHAANASAPSRPRAAARPAVAPKPVDAPRWNRFGNRPRKKNRRLRAAV